MSCNIRVKNVFHAEKLDKLRTLNKKLGLNILRIYPRAVETKVFAGADSKPISGYDCPEWAEPYALHYKIRKSTPSAAKLIDFDKKLEEIRKSGKIPNGKTCKDYWKTLTKAEDEVLSEHFDIILCTCNETSSARITRCVFPRQCIVDECGMANEPECITPLELCDHIVLVGDHKQLQPVIDYKPAREHGLSTSLFQRYAERFDGQHIKKLRIQYRMVSDLRPIEITLFMSYSQHKAICKFPSNHFYEGELETAESVKMRSSPGENLDGFWPGPQKSRCPIVFCNVIGKEDDHKTGSKAAGGKKIGTDSKRNETEAIKVVSVHPTYGLIFL